ncbi:hypothetical protein SAMN05660484_02029 [Eubacterium ruminantium]|uniref:Uncharacterized protein n=1 Tax=Eubacterium ruminantium TaxID=42322 RepID=A0A1T4PKC8_9FIRM|nr:hypothetical protein [Eubacterium ruminantium]SCW60384.1 hypothetical protein SAMN05660484_02029 [Eubacterium ruminantium]SDN12042.1 hypothetical protein SAMN04490370_11071 [Eubacterium ruminantium]SJZ91801.1 hypothetical protein SAMN02745110_02030 [Eubacterium ruminantium]
MPEISSMKLPSGSVYDIKDATAREMIAALNQFTYEIVTTLPTASEDTMYIIYLKPAGTVGTGDNYEEYITIDKGASVSPRYVWEKMGTITPPDLSDYAKIEDLGDLAWKDTASGTVAVPKTYTFTGTSTTGTVSGTASAQTFTGTGVRLETDSEVATGGSFTGASMTSTGSFTPSGSISVGTGTANYTPSGTNASSSVSGSCSVTPSGTIAVKTAGATTTVNSITAVGTLPNLSTTVEDEVLTIGWNAGTLPTKGSDTSVKIGDAAYDFTGTASSGTISGTAAAQTFTGTGKELKFTGSAGNISVSGTTTGSISLTKSAVTISPAASGTPTYTPAGSNASSSISGSANITATGNVTTATTENKTVTVS